jgi:hypothetical protein
MITTAPAVVNGLTQWVPPGQRGPDAGGEDAAMRRLMALDADARRPPGMQTTGLMAIPTENGPCRGQHPVGVAHAQEQTERADYARALERENAERHGPGFARW